MPTSAAGGGALQLTQCGAPAVQVIEDKVEDSFYKLTSRTDQIRAYVFDVVRSAVPKMDLDHVFISKEDIARDVKEQLTLSMDGFGLCIIQVLAPLPHVLRPPNT